MPTSRKSKAPAPPLGRYFCRFTLENVRTFRSKVTLDFCQRDGRIAQWTVILGENGTGKTTLLQYLAGTAPKDKRETPLKPAYGPTLAALPGGAWHLDNLPAGLTSGDIRAVADVSASVGSLSLASIDFSPTESVHLKIDIRAKNEDRYLIKVGAWESHHDKTYLSLHLFGYGASRHIAGPASPYLSSETFFKNGGSESTSTLFHDDHPLISPEQWLLGLHHTASLEGPEGRQAKRSYESARRCLIHALPEVEDIAVKQRKTRKGLTQMTVMCRTAYGEVPFSALSLGYRTMAAWLIDFVKRMHETYPELDEPDDGPAVVLIDEFDLHMHPKWQREAMGTLSREFPNTQFIVTAHSPLIVQAAGENTKIVVLRKQKREDGTEEVVIDDHPRGASGWQIDQILQSLYGLSPFSPRHEELMRQRVALRQRGKLSPSESRKLTALEAELDAIESTGEESESQRLLRELKEAIGGVTEKKAKRKRKS